MVQVVRDERPNQQGPAEEEGGIAWRELLVDKSIDMLLIPLGLFAALWFQNWVDEQKEKEDYAALVKDFKSEVARNLSKTSALEKDVGPISARETDGALGDLQASFNWFRADLEKASGTIACIDGLIEDTAEQVGKLEAAVGAPAVAEAAAAEPAAVEGEAAAEGEEAVAEGEEAAAEGEEAVAEAEKKAEEIKSALAAAEASDPNQTFAACLQAVEVKARATLGIEDGTEVPDFTFTAVDLSPFYDTVVWQVYLSNGIKLFKDAEAKQLGLQLGLVYASTREVDQRVEEIEKVYNDSFMTSIGQAEALVTELGELLEGDEIDFDELKQNQERIVEIGEQLRALRFGMNQVESVTRSKVVRLKEFVEAMNGDFVKLGTAMDTEIARLAK